MTDPRVISVVLSDEEWKALMRVQPQPIACCASASAR